MKIWRCNYYDKDQGCLVTWHPTRARATSHLYKRRMDDWIELKNKMIADGEIPIRFKDFIDHQSGPSHVESVEIPTTKKALIDWLNIYFDTDNG